VLAPFSGCFLTGLEVGYAYHCDVTCQHNNGGLTDGRDIIRWELRFGIHTSTARSPLVVLRIRCGLLQEALKPFLKLPCGWYSCMAENWVVHKFLVRTDPICALQ